MLSSSDLNLLHPGKFGPLGNRRDKLCLSLHKVKLTMRSRQKKCLDLRYYELIEVGKRRNVLSEKGSLLLLK